MRRSCQTCSAFNVIPAGLLAVALATASVQAGYPQVGGTGALEFDGVNDFVTLGNRSSYQFPGDMSLCAWYKLAPGNAGREMGIVAKMLSQGNSHFSGYGLFRYDDNDLCFLIGPGLGSGFYYDAIWADRSFTDTEWHHVAGVIRQGNAYLYVDGVQAGYMNQALKIRDSGQDLLVGKYCSNVDGWYFEGRIDEVYLYSRGLSTSEVQAMLSTRPSTADAKLVGYWSFDETGGQVVSDGSGHGNNGYLGSTSGTDASDPRRVTNAGTPTTPNTPCRSQWSYLLTFDSDNDMARVTSNNARSSSRSAPVQRVTDQQPDRAGMLRLQDYPEVASGFPIPAQATFTFNDALCWSGENEPLYKDIRISIHFDYLFRSAGGTLRVWVRYGTHEYYAPSLKAPAPPSPGSSTSMTWATYSAIVTVPYDASTPPVIQVILELRGASNTAVLINNLSIETMLARHTTTQAYISVVPPVQCNSYCGDITGNDHYVGQDDYLAAAYHCGVPSRLPPLNTTCVEGNFTYDGFTSVEDVEFIAWVATDGTFCSGGLQALSALAAPETTIAPNVYAAALNAPLLIAGKAFTCNPSTQTRSYWSDRVFGFDFSRNRVGETYRRTDDRLNTRLVKDNRGDLYQLNVKEGLVRLDGQVLQDCRSLQFGANWVDIGWIEDYQSPPIQDVAFDASGDFYVVPVSVTPFGSQSSYRAAARIRPGASPAANIVIQLYKSPGLYATGVHEIEIDNSQDVYVLDKRNWTDSRLFRYQRDSGVLTLDLQLSTVANTWPTAFHVSRKDGQIVIANGYLNTPSLLLLNPANLTAPRTIQIQGLSYISDLAEYTVGSSARTIWATGFTLPTESPSADLANKCCLDYPPLFKPCIAEVPLSSNGPIVAQCLSEYGEDGQEYLSLPLSIICTEGIDY